VVHADRLRDLSVVLERDPDEKARIAAAVGLGRLGDERAVPALIKALADRSAVVRGVAASALGHLGDVRAIEPLARLENDPSESVRSRVRDALAILREKQARASGGGRPVAEQSQYVAPRERPLMRNASSSANARHTVTVKTTSNRTAAGGKELGNRLRYFLVSEVEGSPELSLGNEGTYVIDGAIVSMNRTTSGRWIEMRCEVQISISNSKGKILSIVTGAATLQVPASHFKPQHEKALWDEALENAVRGAHQNLVAYMSRQI
jgi:hypothetical protein